jgi:class 3 adenylate cyclase
MGHFPALAGCSRAQLARIEASTAAIDLAADRVLVREGARADQVLFLASGRGRATVGGTTVGVYEPGSCIGARSVVTRTANPATVTAETPVTVHAASARDFRLLIDIPAIDRLVEEEPMLSPITPARPDELDSPGGGGTTLDAVPSDRTLAAVLFTDIVESTAHLTLVGDAAWHGVLDAHDVLVQREVRRHGGTVVNLLGDGMVARFDCVKSAIWCGLAIRDGLRELGLEVRSGVHAGEIELRDSGISGIAVHIAHRICRVADAGHILVSGTAVDLLAGSGLTFEPAGTHRLKGLGAGWPLFSVSAVPHPSRGRLPSRRLMPSGRSSIGA